MQVQKLCSNNKIKSAVARFARNNILVGHQPKRTDDGLHTTFELYNTLLS